MGKRKRQSSTSTTESVDKNALRVSALAVLKPINRKLEDSNEWPVFLLEDASIFSKDGRQLENALFVEQRGPFLARGRLVIEEAKQRSHLLPAYRSASSVEIEIEDCQKYYIGLSQDDRPVVWISGPSGWYEIEPSPQYLSLYNRMCMGVGLYYHILEMYESCPRRQPSINKVLHKYAVRVGDGSVKEDVLRRCKEFAPFIVSHIQAGKDSQVVDWGKKKIYQMLTTMITEPEMSEKQRSQASIIPTTTDIVQTSTLQELPTRRSKRRKVANSASSNSDTDLQHSQRSTSPDLSQDSAQLLDMAQTPKAIPIVPSSTVSLTFGPDTLAKPAASLRSLETVLEALLNIWNGSNGITNTPGTLGHVTYQFLSTFRISDAATSRDILHFYAKHLVDRDEMQIWHGSECYDWLKVKAAKPWTPTSLDPTREPILVPRQRRGTKSSRQVAVSPPQHIHRTPDTRADVDATRQARGRLSGKGASLRLTSRTITNQDNDDVHQSIELAHSSLFLDQREDDPPTGDGAGGTTIEPHSTAVQAMPAFGPFTESAILNGISGPVASPPPPSDERYRLIIRSELLPSTFPQAKNDTWICEEFGCGYIVRAGKDPAAQLRIREHIRDHDDQNERIKLLKFESKGLLPITHLLDKIKRVGDRAHTAAQLSHAFHSRLLA